MDMTPVQEKTFKDTILAARVMWLILCLLVPLGLIAVHVNLVPHGSPGAFFTGFGGLSWRQPAVFIPVLASALVLASAGVLPEHLANAGRLREASPFVRLRNRHIVTCIFLDAIAAMGLVLGPQVASLALSLMLVPMVAGCIIFPNSSDWRYRFALENQKS
jgi:hypothetical protein